jgi:hypothetical protein
MAIPKSVRERIHRKKRQKKVGVSDTSTKGRIVPKKSADNDPIPKYRQIQEALNALRAGVSPKQIVEELDENVVVQLSEAVSRLMTMQLGGWSKVDDKFIHDSGIVMKSEALVKAGLELKEGTIVIGKTGQQFIFCDRNRLYEMLSSLYKTVRILDLERKLDLFTEARRIMGSGYGGPVPILVKNKSKCMRCGGAIEANTWAEWEKGYGVSHMECPPRAEP